MLASVKRALIAFGIACLVFYGIVTVERWRYQREAKADVQQMVSAERPALAWRKASSTAARYACWRSRRASRRPWRPSCRC